MEQTEILPSKDRMSETKNMQVKKSFDLNAFPEEVEENY